MKRFYLKVVLILKSYIKGAVIKKLIRFEVMILNFDWTFAIDKK